MPAKFIFTNILGTFAFTESHKPAGGLLFRDIGQYNEKEAYEDKLRQKHGNLAEPEGNDLYSILLFFKDGKYFPEFLKKNRELSRESIRNSVGNDALVMQAINIIDEIDKSLNSLSKRLRDWYSLYNPEASNKIKDHEKFASLIAKHSKSRILEEFGLEETDSFGSDLKQEDVSEMLLLASQISNLYALKKHYEDYINNLEKEACPNLATVVGAAMAAKLIRHAGSLKRLAEMPASTLQILGAEKALFRHMRNSKNRPPKYGMLHEHQLIQKSKKEMHGKTARALADKASIAARVDYFKGKFIGAKLKKGLVDKFKIEY